MPAFKHEIVIIGGGPAGLSAALWADELKIDAVLLESAPESGGQLLRVHNRIDNHLGSSATNGLELRDRFLGQISVRPIRVFNNIEVSSIDSAKQIIGTVGGDTYDYRFLIYSTGVRRRKLGIPGENRFRGLGILESGKRQAELAKGKIVSVIGGGDAAFENAIILSGYANKVFLIHRRSEFSARDEFVNRVLAEPKIEVVTNAFVTEIHGQETIEGVSYRDRTTDRAITLPTDLVIFRIGVVPNAGLLNDQIDKDGHGYIIVDASCKTSVDSIYAIGDVANPLSPTISSAVGMGSTAVKAILSNLRS
jgi:thioredoxin reductase (NADPH)